MSMSMSAWYRKVSRATSSDIRDVSQEISSASAESSNQEQSSSTVMLEPYQHGVFEDLTEAPVGCDCDGNSDLGMSLSFSAANSLTADIVLEGYSSSHNSHGSQSDIEILCARSDDDIPNKIPKPCVNEDTFKVSENSSQNLPKPKDLKIRLAEWALTVNITHTALSSLLKLLHSDCPDLPLDARTLLGTVRDKAPILPMGKGHFIYFGISSNILELLQAANFYPSKVVLTFNIDGQSPFKSSKMELWPTLGKVDGITHKPFIVNAYYGRSKPESPDEFLKLFVEELNDLITNGLCHDSLKIEVRVRAFICDFPAMAFIKCILNSNGFVGCTKCFVRGLTVQRTRVYHDLNAKLRTDENFRKKEQPEHHKGDGLLLKVPNLDLVKNFPLEPMHVIFINVVKKLCSVWRKGKKRYCQVQIKRGRKTVTVFRKKARRGNKMTAAAVQGVEDKICAINKCKPKEFARILDLFSDSDSWKATQCRQFITYSAPVVMKGILSDDLYDHMLKLHMACRIMTSEYLCAQYLDEAQVLLTTFVRKCKFLLGIDFTTQAVHALIHLVADCREHGTLDSFSAFLFESFQAELRKLIRGYARPLQQIWKRLGEQRKDGLSPIIDSQKDVISQLRRAKHCYGPTCGREGADHYFSLSYRNMFLSVKSTDNTLCLDDGSIIRASNFLKDGSLWFVVGRMFKTCTDFYPNSSKVFVWKVQGLSSHDFIWELDRISGKAVLYPHKHFFVCMKLLHT